MKKYKYGVKRITIDYWYIQAETKEEALKKAKKAEKNGDFTLGNVKSKEWAERFFEEVTK